MPKSETHETSSERGRQTIKILKKKGAQRGVGRSSESKINGSK